MDDLTRWSVADPSSDTSGTRHNNNQNNRIVVLGATNTPWMIDKAFLRPGRFDRAVHVGLPDMNEREAILRVHTMNMKIASLRNDPSPSDKICNSIAKICIGFSGADLAALCRAAAVRCLSEKDGTGGVEEKHFNDAFMYDVLRSSQDALVQRISKWQP